MLMHLWGQISILLQELASLLDGDTMQHLCRLRKYIKSVWLWEHWRKGKQVLQLQSRFQLSKTNPWVASPTYSWFSHQTLGSGGGPTLVSYTWLVSVWNPNKTFIDSPLLRGGGGASQCIKYTYIIILWYVYIYIWFYFHQRRCGILLRH